MKCKKCNFEIGKNDIVCPHCGENVYVTNNKVAEKQENSSDKFIRYKDIYVIIAILFGIWGIHSFYLGNYKKGMIQFVLSILGLGIISLIITIIDILFILNGQVTTDSNGETLENLFSK